MLAPLSSSSASWITPSVAPALGTVPTFCLGSAGAFFLAGLVFGAWKYAWIARTAKGDAKAPYYVDVAHRAALLYAFACALLSQLCARSCFPPSVLLAACIVLVVYFAVSVLGYVVHGALRDTENQLAEPHRLGAGTVSRGAMRAFMVSLVLAEISAFGLVLVGFLFA